MAVVLLTGSTGNFGSELLALLLSSPIVERIYLFNRRLTQATQDRQRAAFEDKGFNTDVLNSTKIVWVDGVTSQWNLGIAFELYEEIRLSVTIIIHNAWPISLVGPPTHFEAHILGTKNLIQLATNSPMRKPPRFIFVSSAMAAQPFSGVVPEGPIPFENSYQETSYGRSKLLTEKIIFSGTLPATILRLGQLCGSRSGRGLWSMTEWLPLLVRCSVMIGFFPQAGGMAPWLPTDVAAQIAVELALADGHLPPVINLVHHRPVSTQWIIETVHEVVEELVPSKISAVHPPFQDWVVKLNAFCQSKPGAKGLPSPKYLSLVTRIADWEVEIRKNDPAVDYFGMSRVATGIAREYSASFGTMQPLQKSDVRGWVVNWVKSGALDMRDAHEGSKL